MISFIMMKKEKIMSGAEIETFYHIDDDVNALEKALCAGGHSEDQYEIHKLIGVEIIKK